MRRTGEMSVLFHDDYIRSIQAAEFATHLNSSDHRSAVGSIDNQLRNRLPGKEVQVATGLDRVVVCLPG